MAHCTGLSPGERRFFLVPRMSTTLNFPLYGLPRDPNSRIWPQSGYLQNPDHVLFCASSALLVAVVRLSAWATLIGFTHPHPSAGALILAQPAIKFIVTKSVQMGSDFCHPFGPSLSSFEADRRASLAPALRNPQSR